MAQFDDMKLAVEAMSGGKNTVILDDQGMPSIMVRIPKFYLDDVMPGAPHVLHPAFIVNGVEKNEISISKFQNIVMNGRAYSLPFKSPQTSLTFDTALNYCKAKGAGWHLMTNAEWAAVALWCKKNGTMPRGNNKDGQDYQNSHEKGVEVYSDKRKTERVATGSGPVSWAHDNTNAGIFDLNGNVWEWVSGLRLVDGEIQIIPDNDAAVNTVDQSSGSQAWKAIKAADGSLVVTSTEGTLKYDATLEKGFGSAKVSTVITSRSDGNFSTGNAFQSTIVESGITIPDVMKALGLFPLDNAGGAGQLYTRNQGERLAYRGGCWMSTLYAGVFAMHLYSPRSYSHASVGFRSAFVL